MAAFARTTRASSAGRAAPNLGGNSMSRHRIAIVACIAVATVGGALACGPDFPWQLLDDRQTTMTEPVAFGFSFDAIRLVAAPQDMLRAVEQLDGSTMPPPEPESIVI